MENLLLSATGGAGPMNRQIGLWSAALTALATVGFALSMALTWNQTFAGWSYGICLALAWSYLVLACALAAMARDAAQAAALSGVTFAVLHAAFVTTVYFIQLTTVLHASAAPELLAQLSYSTLGGLAFNLELLGYGLMAISTVFLGLSLTVNARRDRCLRGLLIGHGVFAPFCIVAPITGLFSSPPAASGNLFAIMALTFWCAYFAPAMALAFLHFRTLPIGVKA